MQTVYDARTSLEGSGVAFVCFFVVILCVVLATLGWLFPSAEKRSAKRGRSSRRRLAVIVPALVAVTALSTVAVRALLIHQQRYALDHGRYERIKGCVQDYSENLYRDGHLAIDTFSVNGHRFEINDSDWTTGFRTTQRRGGRLANGVPVEIYRSGRKILLLRAASTLCSPPLTPTPTAPLS
jgi:Na+-transporting methylmalonyl-CoA/oxaloacetate decarboxylase gamma subunit